MNRILRGAASGCLALLTLLAIAAPRAQAGTYTVASCRGPVDEAVPIGDAWGGWRHETSPRADSGLSFADTCSAGENFRVGVGGATVWPDPYIYSQTRFAPPADTRIAGFSIEWDGYGVPAAASKVGFVTLSTDQSTHEYHPGAGLLNRRWTHATGLDASWVALHAGCQGGNVACGGTEPNGDAWARIVRSKVTLRDESSPIGVAFGEAKDRATWTGSQSLTVDAEDRGGGVYSAAVEIDGAVGPVVRPDTNGGRCIEAAVEHDRVFTTPRPCKADPAAVDITIPAASTADGPHPVRVLLEDASRNVRALSLGTKLFDSHPPVLDGQAAVAGTAREGDTLACTIGGIDGQSPEVRYEWVRTNADGSGRAVVGGATGDGYTLTAADVGRKVLCRITATDAGGSAVSESALTSGPFADGRTVVAVCDGMPTGPKDQCGDLDGDGIRNRDDRDADGDGVDQGSDPDDLNAAATGRDATTPSSVTTTVTTTTHTNTATETVRETHAIPDGPAGQINGALGGPGASLSVHHEGTSSRTIRVSHGRRVVIEGRLTAPDGRGVEGAKLEISTQDRASGSAMVPFGALLTGAKGAYRLILPAGPSRTVRVGYRARFGDASFTQTSNVTVLVRAGLQFRLSRTKLRNGRSVRYSGRLLGPRTGHRFVEVQVRSGKRWIVVCSVRTDAKGGYGCAHRFTKTFRRTRYVFRARVRRQATLPYEPTVSRTRSLTVRP